MIKKIFCITFVLVFISTQLLASFGEGDQSYSLFELEQLVLKNNLEYIRLTEELEKKKQAFDDATVQAIGVKSSDFSDEPYNNYEVEVKANLTPIKTESEYLKTKFEHINLKNKLIRELKNMFMTLKFENSLLEVMKEDFSVMKRLYESKEKEKELGVISEIQFMEFEKNYKESFRNLLIQINKVDRQKRDMAIMAGIDVSKNFDLEISGVKTWDYSDLPIDKYKDNVLESSYMLKSLILEKEVTEMELSFKHRFAGFSNAKFEIEQLTDKIADLKRQYNYKINDINYDVLSTYNNVLIEKENLDIANINIEKAIREDKALKIRYETGLVSELDFLKGKSALNKASYENNIARLAYTMAVETYKDYYETNTMKFRD